MNQTAVVILNYNGQKFLAEYLPNVLENTPSSAQIIVADNASTDNSVQFLKENFPQVTLIQLSQNFGFAGGYNLALKQVTADILVLLNSDVKVQKGWLEPLITALQVPQVAAVQPKIKSIVEPSHFEYAGAAGGFIDKLGYPFCRGRIADFCEEDSGQYDLESEIFWASGACFAIKTAVFKQMGGFDAHFFAHMEEIDLCWRIKAKGFSIKYIPQSTVLHLGGGTLHKSNPRKTFLNFRNGLAMIYKNLPQKNRFWIILQRLIFDGLIGVRFLLKGQLADLWAVIKAHFAFYEMILSGKIKRNSSVSTNNELNGIYKNIILFDILKNKDLKFSDLDFDIINPKL